MNTNTHIRYYISDKINGEIFIFDSETGTFQYPACGQDLSAYYHYLVGRSRTGEAQDLLGESIAGNKPITNMLKNVGRPQLSQC